MRAKQLDMFPPPAPQPVVWNGKTYPPGTAVPNPDRVRARAKRLIAEARAADVMPWDERTTIMWRVVIPQSVRCLPPDEAAALTAEFKAELARLDAAANPANRS